MSKPAPLTLAEMPADWPEIVREMVQREGYGVRAGAEGVSIEAQSIKTGEWLAVMLPGGSLVFASAAERDAVLARIIGKKVKAA